MSTDDSLNAAIRTRWNRGRFTIDESPRDAGTVEMNRLIRRQPVPEVEPDEVDAPKIPVVPDLGQGARGSGLAPTAPNMSALLRRQLDWRRSGFGELHPHDEQA